MILLLDSSTPIGRKGDIKEGKGRGGLPLFGSGTYLAHGVQTKHLSLKGPL